MPNQSDPLELQDEVATYDTRNMTYAELVRMIPRRLYKYQSINLDTLDGLRNHALWFSSPGQFNDPFDCDVSCFIGRNRRDFEDRLESFFGHVQGNVIVRTFGKSAKGWKKKNEGLMDIFRFFYRSMVQICCLSASCDNVLMWSHYANQHQGMCLVFNSHKAGLIRDNVLPVQYYDQYPSDLVDARRIDDLAMLTKQLLAAKSSAWSYEREWRVFMVNAGNAEDTKGALYQYDPSLLSGVVFGINTSPSDIDLVKDAIAEWKCSRRIRLYQARAVKDEFKIAIRGIGCL